MVVTNSNKIAIDNKCQIRDFTNLEIYKIASRIIDRIYICTVKFPSEEKYIIIAQLKRAVLSIGANIAEAFGRYYFKDKLRFYYNARGSLYETKHFIIESRKRGYITEKQTEIILSDIQSLSVKLNNTISSIMRQINK